MNPEFVTVPPATVREIDVGELRHSVGTLLDGGFRLALAAAHHDVPDHGADREQIRPEAIRHEAIRMVYLLVATNPDRRIELHVRLPIGSPTLPSLADLSFTAGRFEREAQDLYGVQLIGHHQPARLVLHQHWPAGWYPMRHDAGPPPPFEEESASYPFLTVEGPGVYEIPVGPVHAGVIEPGHFRFSVVGETILNMKARLWFVHKGIEKLFEGRAPDAGVELAERISGDTAVGHNLAYCLAVEQASDCEVPENSQIVRAILLELERIYNHVTDLGAMGNDVGFGIAHAHTMRIREQLLRLNARITGHRLLRGGVLPGAAHVHWLPEPNDVIAIRDDIREVVDIMLSNATIVDRFAGTAVLSTDDAHQMGVLGYIARASGLDVDARRDHPFAGIYRQLSVPVHTDGDVMSRFQIRIAEIDASLTVLDTVVRTVTPGTITSGPTVAGAVSPAAGPVASGVGIVEGWRGTIVHRVELGPDQRLTRVKVVDPSFFNWPALPVALAGTIVPDFPLANKSFNLSYAGNDL